MHFRANLGTLQPSGTLRQRPALGPDVHAARRLGPPEPDVLGHHGAVLRQPGQPRVPAAHRRHRGRGRGPLAEET